MFKLSLNELCENEVFIYKIWCNKEMNVIYVSIKVEGGLWVS